ncbi:MAG: co-chaperone GroES [Clostridiales bacterium]|mgnify:CR=1 FL=1|jgi:chaperonin GroES|nr:co-chaperone GroES [Clostridiales bacterium]
MNIKPLGDRVVLRQIDAEEKTKSGIILTTNAKEKPSIFEVLVVGDGIQNDGTEVKMILKVGDKVITNKYSGMTAKVEDEELVIVRQSDILALIED